MANPHGSKRTLHSYPIKAINKTIKPGDCVLIRPSETSNPPYIARVERLESDARGAHVQVHVSWYYRPEESIAGRRRFHGLTELFLSDHFDVQSADTIEGKCKVHSFKRYTKLDAVGNDDFFCRFEYNSSTGAFTPDWVAVFHPACIDMTAEEAKRLYHFFCQNCSSDDPKKLLNSHAASRHSDTKVETKRRRR